jgi:hypothetical protein
MINAAFNIAIYTGIFFILGMIKPKWPLFFLKKPDRFLIIAITTIMVMVCATLYGEGNRQAKLAQEIKEKAEAKQSSPAPAPASAPLPMVNPPAK